MLTTFFLLVPSLRVGESVPHLLCFLGVDSDSSTLLELLYMSSVEIIIILLLLTLPPYNLQVRHPCCVEFAKIYIYLVIQNFIFY